MSQPSPPGDGNNHRVTNAVLQNELKHLRTDLDRFRQEWLSWCKDHDNKHDSATAERRGMDQRITRNEERIRNSTGVLAAVQAAAFAVSTWLGTKF